MAAAKTHGRCCCFPTITCAYICAFLGSVLALATAVIQFILSTNQNYQYGWYAYWRLLNCILYLSVIVAIRTHIMILFIPFMIIMNVTHFFELYAFCNHMYHLISDPHVAEHVGGREIPPEQAAGVQAILLGQMLTIMIVNFLFFISIKRAYSLLKQEKRDAVTEIRRTTSAP